MSVHEIRELSPAQRGKLSAQAKKRKTELMQGFAQHAFDELHVTKRQEIQAEVDLCNRTTAFVAFVRDTEE